MMVIGEAINYPDYFVVPCDIWPGTFRTTAQQPVITLLNVFLKEQGDKMNRFFVWKTFRLFFKFDFFSTQK